MRNARRPLAVVSLALAVSFVTSCSLAVNDKQATNDTTQTQPDPVAPSAPARGVSDDAIKLGAAIIDAEKVKSNFGVDIGMLPPEALTALAAGVNEDGGINGRLIDLVVRKFLPVGDGETEKACRELIEDAQVFAVMGMFVDEGGLCVTETYSTPYFGIWGQSEARRERSKAPYITAGADVSEQMQSSISLLEDQGTLKDHKVAVFWQKDLSKDWVESSVISELKAAGINVVSQAQLPDSGDQAQAAADMDRILQRFESDGADTVITLAGTGVLLPALQRSSYRPRMVFANNGQVLGDDALKNFGLSDFAALDGAIAVLPGRTVPETAADPGMLACIATINAHSTLDITTDDLFGTSVKPNSRGMTQLVGLCQMWEVTIQALKAAGPTLNAQTLVTGLDNLDDFDLPNSPNTSLSSTKWGAGQPSRLWHFDPVAKKFLPDQPVSTS